MKPDSPNPCVYFYSSSVVKTVSGSRRHYCLIDVASSYLIVPPPPTVSPDLMAAQGAPGDQPASTTGRGDIAPMAFPPRSEAACRWERA